MSISSYLALATKQYGEKITEATPLPVGTMIRLLPAGADQPHLYTGQAYLYKVVDVATTGVWVRGTTQTVKGPRATKKIWISRATLASCNYRLAPA